MKQKGNELEAQSPATLEREVMEKLTPLFFQVKLLRMAASDRDFMMKSLEIMHLAEIIHNCAASVAGIFNKPVPFPSKKIGG